MNALIRNTVLLLLPAVSLAQVPVDDDGNVVGPFESQAEIMQIADDGIYRLSPTELQELVGPIALYPDDLLAIVLPASAYPLQIVEAARFLEALDDDPSLQADPEWDDSIIALINYPEIVELLNEDLKWTRTLGEAVVSQQADVVAAVESFRDRAYAAGNLKSDSYQTVTRDEGVINITPTAEDVIYVPYYEPSRVVYYQPSPVYYYYPRPYPVYYYPYAADHYFRHGYFWGVTTAFSIGWFSNSLYVHHHSYYGHPYYGRTYWNDGWYRQPQISAYNRTYINNTNVTVNHHSNGDQWRANEKRREYVRREGYARATNRDTRHNISEGRRDQPIAFREREARTVTQSRATQKRDSRRQAPVDFGSDTKRQALTSTSYVARQPAVVRRSPKTRKSPTTTDTRRDVPNVQRSDSHREAVVRQSRQSPVRTTNRAPAQTQRAPTRTQRAPTRTQQAPTQTQPRHTESRQREQPSRSRESRSQVKSKPSAQNRRQSKSRSRDR